MACNIQLQQTANKNFKSEENLNEQSVVEILRSVTGDDTYSIEQALLDFEGKEKEKLVKTLNRFDYDFNKSSLQVNLQEKINNSIEPIKIKTKIKPVNNINSIFTSPNITDLFSNMDNVGTRFENRTRELIINASKIGNPNSDHLVKNNIELNNNIKDLKNYLFETILEYLKNNSSDQKYVNYFNNGILSSEYKLYKSGTGEVQNYDLYKEALHDLQKVFLGPGNIYALDFSKDKRLLPSIRGSVKKLSDRTKMDTYGAAILLSNFDNVIAKYYGNSITLDYSVYNNLNDPISNPNGKYSLREQGKKEEYFSNETHEAEGVSTIEDELSRNIINIIQHVDKHGVESGMYLDIKNLYSLGSFIRTFELKNLSSILESQKNKDPKYTDWVPLEEEPKRMLQWYTDKILDAHKNNFTGEEPERYKEFKNKVDIVRSIDNFVKSIALKEENSPQSIVHLLTQVLTNTYGANYTIYNIGKHFLESKEMHSHDALRVDVQNSVYAHLLQYSQNPEKFYIGVKVDKYGNVNLDNELESIKTKISSDISLSKLIKDTLGIYIGEKGARDLRELWGDLTAVKIQNYLRPIRNKVLEIGQTGDGSSILDDIITNEKIVSDKNYSEIKTQSEVINKVSSNIQDIIDIYLDNHIDRVIMNISTLSGEKIPTFKVANMTYNDTSLLLKRNKLEIEHGENRHFRSLFLSHGGLLGTATGLEAINGYDNKSVFRLNTLENFTANFEYGFLDSFRASSKNSGIHVIIGNYSDKSTILSKIIDKNFTYGINNEYVIGNIEGKNIMPIEDVLKLVRNQNNSFYTDIIKNNFEQYKKLGVKIHGGIKVDPRDIKTINDYLSTFKSKDDFLKEVINKSFSDPSINIMEELHYSNYIDANGNKRLALNQTILDYFNTFSNEIEFNKFVKRQEKSLADKLTGENESEYLFDNKRLLEIESSEKNKGDLSKSVFDTYKTSLGINDLEYKSFVAKDKNNEVIGHKIQLSTNKINPLLKRWLWTNNLFKNEYLFLTVKPEYMHPHKISDLQFRGDKPLNVDEFIKESSARIPNMSKRNVSFTATYENGIKNSKIGNPIKVNVAVIDDLKAQVFNLSGKTHNQDIHDGSSIISYAYAKMIEASYPGKGYEGTKKRIGTFITEFGSALKKDAETVLTNSKIRESQFSNISFKDKQRQALSTIDLPNIENFSNPRVQGDNIFYKNGDYFRITGYKIENNNLTLILGKYNKEQDLFKSAGVQEPIPIKNLYDIWEAFGGEYSITKDGKNFRFSEGSNDLIYNLITTYEKDNECILKNNMIHIISNHSAFKSGATNLNPSSSWTDSSLNKLGYTTLEGTYMGPQLDAGHESNDSKIKEITQIISALSQSTRTAYLASEVYKDIARIIEESAKPYIAKTTNLDEENIQKYYLSLSRSFAFSLAKSDSGTLAKTIAESFGDNTILPFSNQNFFREFSRDLITKMNNEFIIRYYQGIGAVLNPSHGIIQLYENRNGEVYTQEDIAKQAFNWYNSLIPETRILKSNKEIVAKYIENNFQDDTEATRDQIQPGDTVIYNTVNTVMNNDLHTISHKIRLDTIEAYYDFKLNGNGKDKVTKVYSTPRDLKPSNTTFKVGEENLNSFDLQPVQLRYTLGVINNNNKLISEGKPEKISNENSKHLEILKQLANYWGTNVNDFKRMDFMLNRWTQRNLDLMDYRIIMEDITNLKFQTNGLINFNEYFNNDPLINKRLDEVIEHYRTKNSRPIENYKNQAAELILGNMYKSTFDIGEDSMQDIKNTVNENGKNIYFENKLRKTLVPDSMEADLKLVLDEKENPVYIKYVTEFPSTEKEDPNLFSKTYDPVTAERIESRISSIGQPLYIKPRESRVIKYDGYDMIYMKVGSEGIVKDGDTIEKKIVFNSNFNKNIKSLLKSFKGEIKAIVPLMNNDPSLLDKIVSIEGNGIRQININELSLNTFKRFSGFINKTDFSLDSNWFDRNKESIINQLSNKIYTSWDKSNEVVSSRIPAQSMQSFMEMKNIGYFNTKSNDAYVSVWQLWFQGSDFRVILESL